MPANIVIFLLKLLIKKEKKKRPVVGYWYVVDVIINNVNNFYFKSYTNVKVKFFCLEVLMRCNSKNVINLKTNKIFKKKKKKFNNLGRLSGLQF